jgi:hypothetical protein
MVLSLIGVSQTKPLQYQSMYVPKSNQQIWNEVVMANKIIDDAISKAKFYYKSQNYTMSIYHCKEAQKYGKRYLREIKTETYYIMGKSYGQLGKNGKAKKNMKKARKYGLYSDIQVFN